MSEFEENMARKYKDKLTEDYVRAIVRLKEGSVNRRFLVPAFEHQETQEELIQRLAEEAKEREGQAITITVWFLLFMSCIAYAIIWALFFRY